MIFGIVHLIGYDYNRFFASAQYLGDLFVKRSHSGLVVCDEEDYICFLDSNIHLLIDFFLENIFRIDHPTSGIDDGKLPTVPMHPAVLPIARSTGLFGYDGLPALGKAVEQCALAHIRTAYDGD